MAGRSHGWLARIAPLVLITVLVASGRLACDCGRTEPFGIGIPDDDTTQGDDDSGNADDDSAGTPGDDDSAGTPGDDDDSATDPCGAVFEPRSGYDESDPEQAQYTDQGMGGSPAPRHLHTGFHDDAQTSFTVLWETGPDTTASVVEWTVGGDGVVNSKPGYTFMLGYEGGTQARVHEALICDLEPGDTVHYQVGAVGHMTDTYTFTTFDAGADAISFVALGDTRGGHENMHTMLTMALVHDPRFVLHTGDFVTSGSDLEEWSKLFDTTTPIFPGIPLIPTHGNHEMMHQDYFGMVAAPGNEEWYSLDLGPVHMAVVNDSRDTDSVEEQADWLDDDLALSTAPFNVVVTHRPIYSSGSHGPSESLTKSVLPIIDAHEVDLVFSGHDHGYERTVPIRDGEQAFTGGTVYVVTAGGGAYLYNFHGDWYTVHAESAYHYCHVAVEDDELTLRAYRLDGSLMDEFTIEP